MNKHIVSIIFLLIHVAFYESIFLFENKESIVAQNKMSTESLQVLENICLDSKYNLEYFSYIWCYKRNVTQVHFKSFSAKNYEVESENFIGEFSAEESTPILHIYKNSLYECVDENGFLARRYSEVSINCCPDNVVSNYRLLDMYKINNISFIESINEKKPCFYHINICSDLLCLNNEQRNTNKEHDDKELNKKYKKNNKNVTNKKINIMSLSEQANLLNKVKTMFTYAYDSYLEHAYPEGELFPISCRGGPFDPVKLPLVTLIDTMDTLVIMKNFTEFRRTVEIVSNYFSDYNFDMNVSVFETTIRVLGGLLAAHLFAIDPALQIYDQVASFYLSIKDGNTLDRAGYHSFYLNSDASKLHTTMYDNWLLTLAEDLGERLLPAFETHTGIPYGTVNLRWGVPTGETAVASTAGAGSLLVEFQTLSVLTGDARYGEVAATAMEALFARRSRNGLLGKHINTSTGQWVETVSGIGSNSDSFYEYLLKAHFLFPLHFKDLFSMFEMTSEAVRTHLLVYENRPSPPLDAADAAGSATSPPRPVYSSPGAWFRDVDMFIPTNRRNRVESLHGFWPGIEALIGSLDLSASLLNSLFAVWQDMKFLPEEFDQKQWLEHRRARSSALPIANPHYPLRPELIESVYHHFRCTQDRSWLTAAESFVESIQENTLTYCGYAAVKNLSKTPVELDDVMPSFFLSETLKYLYLIFDQDNFIHDRAYIFSTEAHPFDAVQLASDAVRVNRVIYAHYDEVEGHAAEDIASDDAADAPPSVETRETGPLAEARYIEPFCPTRRWWDAPLSYDPNYFSKLLKDTPAQAKTTDRHRNTLLANLRFWTRSLKPSKKIDYYQDYKCSVSSQPPPPLLPAPTRRHAHRLLEKAVQALDVDIGPLGRFDIEVYADGFWIHSQRFGDSVEIANIGQESLLVLHHTMDSTPAASVTADRATNSVSLCSITAVDSAGQPLLQDPPASPAATLAWTAACVPAAFNPPATSSPLLLTVPAAASFTDMLCEEVEGSKPWWGLWGDAAATPSTEPIKSDRTFLAGRGECNFQDKTINAQAAGAKALILSNNEDSIFIMTGSNALPVVPPPPPAPAAIQIPVHSALHQLQELIKRTKQPIKQRSQADVKIRIPAVMITQSAGEALDAFRKRRKGSSVLIELPSFPMAVDSPIMGWEQYPKVRYGQNTISLANYGGWGCFLAANANNEWQLFIVSKEQLEGPEGVSWTASTSYGQPVSSTSSFTLNPVEMYAGYIKRKCPSYLTYDGKNVQLK